jgi:CPA1 family monovalent cation:H+ antiporter
MHSRRVRGTRRSMSALLLVLRDLMLFFLLALLVRVLMKRWTLPYTVGLLVIGLGLGLFRLFPEAGLTPNVIFFLFLPPLLFEGAWSMKLSLLRVNWRIIGFLAGPGLLLSLAVIASLLYGLLPLDWPTALLLASILSPTDPVAVLGLFRHLGVDERLSIILEGESFFNDAVAGSLYQTFLALVFATWQGHLQGRQEIWGQGLLLFVRNAGGGVILGVGLGWLIYQGYKRLGEPALSVTATLIAAYGIYWLANALQTSPIVAVIVAGLMFGPSRHHGQIATASQQAVETFWQILVFLANAILFLLLGLQVHPIPRLVQGSASLALWKTAGLSIGVVLLARLMLVLLLFVASWIRLPFLPKHDEVAVSLVPCLPLGWLALVFWGGLRGALSFALVLAVPLALPSRGLLMTATYAVVLFTLLLQGLSLRWVLRWMHTTLG